MSMTFRTRAEHGLEGAEAALLWDYGCNGIVEEDGDIIAWFPERVELPLEGTWAEEPEEDWLARYYEEAGPVHAGSLVIAPTHRSVEVEPGGRPLWLDPGMAFGSGHHETTLTLLRCLDSLDLSGVHVLDVGAGSGILAIAADLLGAASATGIDNDPATVAVARDNARLNRSRAVFSCATLGEYEGGDPFAIDPDTGAAIGDWPVGTAPLFRAPRRYGVVAANLYAALHSQLLPAYADHLEPGGLLLLSGILTDQADRIEEQLARLPFLNTQRLPEGEWISFRTELRKE